MWYRWNPAELSHLSHITHNTCTCGNVSGKPLARPSPLHACTDYQLNSEASWKFRATMSVLSRLGRSASRLLRIKYARGLIIPSDEKDLLWEADVPPRHPDYLRRIPKAKYDAQFSKEVIKIYEPQEKSSKGITRPSLQWYVIILPLTAGPSQVIPIPFILDTGAPEFVYLCTSAVLALTDVGALKPPNVGMTINCMELYSVLGTLSFTIPWLMLCRIYI